MDVVKSVSLCHVSFNYVKIKIFIEFRGLLNSIIKYYLSSSSHKPSILKSEVIHFERNLISFVICKNQIQFVFLFEIVLMQD